MATILIVDDEADVRRSTVQILSRDDHHCIEAANGKEALAVLRKQKIDLVVLDLMMPVFDGIETLREIRRMKADVLVVLVAGKEQSAWSDGLRMSAAFGADASFPKPFNAPELLTAVAELLASRS